MGERIIFQASGAVDHAFRVSEDLKGWQDNVARYAIGNSRLVLAASTAFAAPLLHPANLESGGIHVRGPSSCGKTTALTFAGSVWGGGGIRGFIRTWRATSNGLEGICLLHNDSLLCLDELSQVSSWEAGQIGYMLANGQGKVRANRNGEARPAAEWRLLFLSSGEISLADKIAEDGRGRRVAAGQQVRVVDIPADAGAGMGLFENLHGFESADAFARYLKTATDKYYGTACRAFIKCLTQNYDAIAPTVKGYIDRFMAENCPKGADGQVSRVASRFGLIAAGGEMATRFGVLPWEVGEADKAAARCFQDWLATRGGVESAEERDAVARVRHFIELHGTSRFEPMGDLVPADGIGSPVEVRINNRVGFRRRTESGGIEYLVFPEAWRTEICAGMDAGAVAKVLSQRGMLKRGSDGKMQTVARIPGFDKLMRVYLLTPQLFADENATEPEHDFG